MTDARRKARIEIAMNISKQQRLLARGVALAAGVSLAAVAGCAHAPIAHGEDFTPAGATTSIGRFAQTQAANGARDDATLDPQHFQGADLNALGEVKLDLMLRAAPSNAPVVVYLDLPHAASKGSVDACEASVTSYLVDAGVPQGQIQLVQGANPNCTTPSAYTLPTIYKADASGLSGTASDALGGGDLNGVGATAIGAASH
jgi:hypothetical protein